MRSFSGSVSAIRRPYPVPPVGAPAPCGHNSPMTKTFTGSASSFGQDRKRAATLALRTLQMQAKADGVDLDDDYLLANAELDVTSAGETTEKVTATLVME